MNLRRAFTYMFADSAWWRKFGLITLVSPVPVFGQICTMGYSSLTLRRMVKGLGDAELPEAKLGWELCWLGLRVMLIALISGIVVGLLGAPLFIGERDTSVETIAPAIVQALQGPSSLLVTVASTVLTAVVMARFALTGSFRAGFGLGKLWALLRAEPAIWIAYAAVGFVLTEGPYGLVWILPFHGGWDIAATIVASTIIWTYGTMINVHLIGQAFVWSNRTASLRAAQVGYRW